MDTRIISKSSDNNDKVKKIIVVGSAVAVTATMATIKIIGKLSLKAIEVWLGM